ncbi:hypothetical protein AB0G86_41215 [Streptomyces scabiei]|uniref:hypothetical protein n=1 Tax=Streptomyces scabiei TaxID=1930 RepID=UPI0033F11638
MQNADLLQHPAIRDRVDALVNGRGGLAVYEQGTGHGGPGDDGDHLIDVAPFRAQRPAAITFTAGGTRRIACPTAPADRRP